MQEAELPLAAHQLREAPLGTHFQARPSPAPTGDSVGRDRLAAPFELD
jgi:hypothetical protein